MSVQDVHGFFTRLGEDKALMEKVRKAGEGFKEQLQFMTGEDFEARGTAETYALLEPIAREAGYSFTLAELDSFENSQDWTLSESELEAVSGGGVCVCVLAGGGTRPEDIDLPCGCVVGGLGGTRCFCFFGGGGTANE